MTWKIIDQIPGLLPIGNIDAGYTPVNGSAAIPSSPMVPGMIVQAIDPTYGAGEFILLRGVGSTIVGSLVTYNDAEFDTTLSANTAVQNTGVAVATAANTSTSQWAWYQISGVAVLAKITGASGHPAVGAKLYQSGTVGKVMSVSAAGKQVVNCRAVTPVSAISTATTVLVAINRPHFQSQIT